MEMKRKEIASLDLSRLLGVVGKNKAQGFSLRDVIVFALLGLSIGLNIALLILR